VRIARAVPAGSRRAAGQRPTHARIAQMAKLSPSTVTRAIAWLTSAGLLGLVSPGTTPTLRPGVLHGLPGQPERNDAAVYVLTIPRRHKPPLPPKTQVTANLSTYPGPAGTVIPPPARARATKPAHLLTASCATARKPAPNG
jgi:hypothetical protein